MPTSWTRSRRGDWLGIANYELHHLDGRVATRWMRDPHSARAKTTACRPADKPTVDD